MHESATRVYVQSVKEIKIDGAMTAPVECTNPVDFSSSKVGLDKPEIELERLISTAQKAVISEADTLLKTDANKLKKEADVFMKYACLKYCTARLEEMSDDELMIALQSGDLAQGKFPEFKGVLLDRSNRI